MNQTNVIKVNNVICERIGNNHARLHGKKVRITRKSYVTNHCLTGKFHSVKLSNN